MVPELITSGQLVRPTLGVVLATDRLATEMGVQGGLVLQVVPGSGAERAGLHPTRRGMLGGIDLGDVITAIEGAPVTTVADVYLLLERHKPGETVRLTVERGGRQRQVDVELGEPG